MSKRLDAGKTGLVLAALLGGYHLGWSILVASGWAQPVIDFVFWLHFIKPIYAIEPFAVARAGMLVAMTAGMGFLMGSIFAVVWNALHKAWTTGQYRAKSCAFDLNQSPSDAAMLNTI